MCGRSQLEAARSRGAARSRDSAAESGADIWVAEAARRVAVPTAFVAHAAPVQIEAAAGLGSSVAGGDAAGGDAAEYGAIGGVAAEDGAADDGAARCGATQRSECDNRLGVLSRKRRAAGERHAAENQPAKVAPTSGPPRQRAARPRPPRPSHTPRAPEQQQA